jgi:NitT/TauT family transport system permease protein
VAVIESSAPDSPRAVRKGLGPGASATITLFVGRIAVGLVILAAWQAIAMSGAVSPVISRTPGQVFGALRELAVNGDLWPAVVSTLSATLIALVLAAVVGITLGIVLGLMPWLDKLVDPYLNAINAMPRIALAPVLIVYFGIGQSGKIALAFSIVVFVMLINAQAGVRAADRELVTLSRVMGMSRPQMVAKIVLPSAVPSIFAGLRLGLIYSLLGVVASELLAAKEGMGQLIAGFAGSYDMSSAYAVMLVLAVLGALINYAMAKGESYLLRWQE